MGCAYKIQDDHAHTTAYRDALFQCMRDALADRAETLILGQGVDDHKGTFGSTVGLAEGIMLALHHGTGGEVVNLGTGTGTTIRELVETLSEITPFTYAFDASKPSGFARRVMNITRARETLGYEPRTSLREGLETTWDWYLEHEGEHEQKVDYFRESA